MNKYQTINKMIERLGYPSEKLNHFLKTISIDKGQFLDFIIENNMEDYLKSCVNDETFTFDFDTMDSNPYLSGQMIVKPIVERIEKNRMSFLTHKIVYINIILIETNLIDKQSGNKYSDIHDWLDYAEQEYDANVNVSRDEDIDTLRHTVIDNLSEFLSIKYYLYFDEA